MKTIKFLIAMAGLLAAIGVLFLPATDGLAQNARAALAVFILCAALFVSRPIPLGATGLLAIALLPLLGVLEPRKAFSLFGSEPVFFLVGAFLLSAAIIKTGLSKRLTLLYLSRFKRNERLLVWGILWLSVGFALIMPEHAVAAVMLPILLELAQSLKLEKGKSRLGKALFLGMAWGAIIGGIGTYLGGARAPLAVGLLDETYGQFISFARWAACALPIVVVLTISATLLLLTFRPERVDIKGAFETLDAELKRLGSMTGNEWKTLFITLVTVALWIFCGKRMGLGAIALLGAVSIFALRVAKWGELEEFVNWGVIFMYGGAIALGRALYETGAAAWLAKSVLPSTGGFMLIVALAVISLVLTEFISNAAVVATILPVGFALASAHGLAPKLIALSVAIPAGLAFSFPIGSPPLAIAYAAGYHSVRDSLKIGPILNAIGLITFIIVSRYIWPILGIGG